ncbi:MAG: glycosyltransferase family 2 protein [Dehalococcoidia bacterium]|nr:glycosyltransferase family 2 protein [Dehalococcoidia bacterium]MCB9486348.1 glycosyltransferase family 2 protein [Thermoflexaceae bacterium]
MPALSVLMPAYNSISTLEKAVASVQWQTFKDWELVIVDDGSSDDTLVLARRLASADPRIRVIAAAHTGRGGARNAAIEAARAGLMIHCDSDDVYFPNAFEKVVARMSGDDEVDLAGPDLVLYRSERPRGWFVRDYPQTHEQIVDHIDKNIMLVRVCTHRRSAVERAGMFNPEVAVLEDWEWLQRCRIAGLRFGSVPGPLFSYRHDLVRPLRSHLSHQRAVAGYRARIALHGQLPEGVRPGRMRELFWLARYPGHVVRDYFLHPSARQVSRREWGSDWPPPRSLLI